MPSGEDNRTTAPDEPTPYAVPLIGRTWLTEHTFEIRFQRPDGFTFQPGQKIKLMLGPTYRTYSLINAPGDDALAICVRHIAQGQISPQLAGAPLGRIFHLSPAFGFFLFQPFRNPAVFIATGTGIAPFVAFAQAGVRDFHLLHGVRRAAELYYHELLAGCARSFIPCLSLAPSSHPQWPQAFAGRVTACLETRLAPGDYDFYLCGRGEMVRDAMRIIDRRFAASRVFTETFF
jgi:benzoate/toluate 1,2-dioxygenase reductase subunit